MSIKHIISLSALIALIGASCWASENNATPEDNLWKAVTSNNKDGVAYALSIQKADIDARGINGITPLMIAVENSNVDMTALLIHKGATVNITDNNGVTALHRALVNGDSDVKEAAIIELLMDNTSKHDINILLKQAIDLDSKKETKLLLKYGAKASDLSEEQKETLKNWNISLKKN